MYIGLTYTARIAGDPSSAADGEPDDCEEEFDSPETIAAIAGALKNLGHEVELMGDGPLFVHRLCSAAPPELVFNIAEGRGVSRSREAWVPALLESFGIAYTGSDPLTLAVALDKDCARRLVRDAGVVVPEGILVDRSVDELADQLAAVPLPAIVKPAYEGSSKGIRSASLVENREELMALVTRQVEEYRQPVVVEEFIDGGEFTVGILGNDPAEIVGIMRVAPREDSGPFVYSLDVKRDWRRRVRYEVPAQVSAAEHATLSQAALAAYRALGCRDVARIDLRLRGGVAYFIEANPLPGLTPGASDLVLLADGVGIGYEDLIGCILTAALQRLSISQISNSKQIPILQTSISQPTA